MRNPFRSTRGLLAITAAAGIVLALDVAAEKALYGKAEGGLLILTVHPLFLGFVGWNLAGGRGLLVGVLLGMLVSLIVAAEVMCIRPDPSRAIHRYRTHEVCDA